MGFLTVGEGNPRPDRRAVLTRALGVAAAGLTGGALAMGVAGPAAASARANQADWRFCSKCSGMFFRGYADDGTCPAGGGHDSAGYNFNLPHDVPATSRAQRDWRFCSKCYGLFFHGYPTSSGVCPAGGGGHALAGYDFVLPHDIPQTANTQRDWRFCRKCYGLFFWGYPTNGSCPAGGGHFAAGYDFVLPYL
ncbi:hypothetical protein [Streptomyces sp. NBC_00091]|uniref:hypothetical protein n=1 Tax=Streptomyces sp. NBC_00091 TaxID=2975648 RepID=UPI00225A5E77|nr:hypothetical protein [Streptomyces sp. NBC_00091]MCX5377811.1 hypothetical protein [Streptomyces sp. NBC_00091]